MVTYNSDGDDFQEDEENEGDLWPDKAEDDEVKGQQAREAKDTFIQKLQNENQKLVLKNIVLSDKLKTACDEVAELKDAKANVSALHSENRRLRDDNNLLLAQNQQLKKYIRYLIIELIALVVVGTGAVCAYSKSKLEKEKMTSKKELITHKSNAQKSVQKSR